MGCTFGVHRCTSQSFVPVRYVCLRVFAAPSAPRPGAVSPGPFIRVFPVMVPGHPSRAVVPPLYISAVSSYHMPFFVARNHFKSLLAVFFIAFFDDCAAKCPCFPRISRFGASVEGAPFPQGDLAGEVGPEPLPHVFHALRAAQHPHQLGKGRLGGHVHGGDDTLFQRQLAHLIL